MLINLTINNGEINLHFPIFMSQIPFEPQPPQYFVALVGDKEILGQEEFYGLTAEECLIDIKNYLRRRELQILELTRPIVNYLEPVEEIQLYVHQLLNGSREDWKF